MGATRLEFRLRMAINTAIVVLGFWAPWIEAWHVDRRMPLLEWLALQLGRSGAVRFTIAVPIVILFSALLAALGALLRVWGTAYLGTRTVTSMDMKAGAMVADGPYRFVRNPLYLGLWFMFAAMAFLMPLSGALFTMILISAFLFRLILGEEAFLRVQLGEPYKLYLRAVPRLMPRLRTNLQGGGSRPHWLRAILAEITPIGVFVSVAFLSWSYDTRLVIRAILICFGASLVVRALMPAGPGAPSTAE